MIYYRSMTIVRPGLFRGLVVSRHSIVLEIDVAIKLLNVFYRL